MKYYFITSVSVIKQLPWITKIGLLLATILTPYVSLMVCLLVFILFDFITGVWASYNEKRRRIKRELSFKSRLSLFWNNFKSRKLRYTAEKMGNYLLVIICFAFFEFFFLKFELGGYTLTKIVAGFLAAVEIRSILENMTRITGKKFYSGLFNIFKKKVEEKTGIDIDTLDADTSNEDAEKLPAIKNNKK